MTSPASFATRAFAWLDQVAKDYAALPALAYAVAIVLLKFFNRETGDAWPSQETIAAKLGASERGVRKAVTALVERGHLEVVRAKGWHKSNRYSMKTHRNDSAPESDTQRNKRAGEFCNLTGTNVQSQRNDRVNLTGTIVPPNHYNEPLKNQYKGEPATGALSSSSSKQSTGRIEDPRQIDLVDFIDGKDSPDQPATEQTVQPATTSTSAPSTDRQTSSRKPVRPASRVPRRRPAVPLPDNFEPDLAYAARHGLDGEREFEKFRDYHLAKGSLWVDWSAAWRTWVRYGAEFARRDRPPDRLVIDQNGVPVAMNGVAPSWSGRERPGRKTFIDMLGELNDDRDCD